jgi:hypothetical protein
LKEPSNTLGVPTIFFPGKPNTAISINNGGKNDEEIGDRTAFAGMAAGDECVRWSGRTEGITRSGFTGEGGVEKAVGIERTG